MEQAEKNKSEVVSVISIAEQMFLFTGLYPDLTKHLPQYFFTSDSYGEQIKNLALVCKYNGTLIDDMPGVHKLIRDFSEQFGYSNEKVAQGLHFKTARTIVDLQTGVFALCKNPYNISWEFFKDCYEKQAKTGCSLFKWRYNRHLFPVATQERVSRYISEGKNEHKNIHVPLLQKLCSEGASLNFTYEDELEIPFIALCSAWARVHNDKVLRQLLKFFIEQHKLGHVDINKVNSKGQNGFIKSLLRSDTHWVKDYFFGINKHHGMAEEGDINLIEINHQDNEGNTALLIYLHSDMLPCCENIRIFIEAGADPEIGNNKGITPLKIVEKGMQGSWKHRYELAYDYLVQVIAEKKKGI